MVKWQKCGLYLHATWQWEMENGEWRMEKRDQRPEYQGARSKDNGEWKWEINEWDSNKLHVCKSIYAPAHL